MSARLDGAGAPLVASGSKIGSDIENYLEKFSVQPLLKSVAGAVVRTQPADPVSFIIAELKHWKTPQLAVPTPSHAACQFITQNPLGISLRASFPSHPCADRRKNCVGQAFPGGAALSQARLHGVCMLMHAHAHAHANASCAATHPLSHAAAPPCRPSPSTTSSARRLHRVQTLGGKCW